MTAKYDRVQFAAGYIDAIKPRNDNEFYQHVRAGRRASGAGAGDDHGRPPFHAEQSSVFRSDQLLCP